MFRSLNFFLRIFIIFSIIGILIISYAVYYFSHDLPDYHQLANYNPPALSRVYSADGKLIEEYANERRIFVPINSIPKSLIEAFISG